MSFSVRIAASRPVEIVADVAAPDSVRQLQTGKEISIETVFHISCNPVYKAFHAEPAPARRCPNQS